MIRRAIRLGVLLSALAAAACGAERDDNTARVTIDVRCDSNADCPSGFACESEAEHGPPTTMCESDAAITCPPGYETKIGYGQTFCRPSGNVGARASHGSMSITARSRKSGHPGDVHSQRLR
jgi:hypothetical protein